MHYNKDIKKQERKKQGGQSNAQLSGLLRNKKGGYTVKLQIIHL